MTKTEFELRDKITLIFGFAALGGVFSLVLTIGTVRSSAALDRYVQRSEFRSCMIEKLEAVCTAAYPLGAIK